MNYFLDPFLVFILTTLIALVALWRGRTKSRYRLWLLTAGITGLVLVCTPAVAYVAAGSLEWWYPPRYERTMDAPAIVVLSGSLRPLDANWSRVELEQDTLYRCLLAAQIYHCGPPCPVIVSGGKVDPSQPGPRLAEAMAGFLARYGVSRDDLILEDRSRSTHENAVETARLLREREIRKVALVTNATHLWRAESCFRAQGIEIVPCGCSYVSSQFIWSLRTFLPSPTAAQRNKAVVHEWVGLMWYWFRGWI